MQHCWLRASKARIRLSAMSLHVVLGAGPIGILVAQLLLVAGHRVRLVRRGPPGAVTLRLSWASGDLADRGFAEQATAGAAVVYDCTTPSYDRWDAELLRLGRGVIYGAVRAGARLVALDNLYMYGKPTGLIREDSPVAPCSQKGELSAQLAEERLDAHRRGDIEVAIGRASDLFGPAVVAASVFGRRFYARVLAGKTAEFVGDLDMPHAYSYAPDVARALVVLGEREEAPGSVWHLPTAPSETTRDLMGRFAAALGVPVWTSCLSPLVLRALGVVAPLMREIAEMAYRWQVPFSLDDTRFRTTFGTSAAPVEDAVRATAEWAKTRWSAGRAPAAVFANACPPG
jgi:nucleoside-diphosphate-sugar epimerase